MAEAAAKPPSDTKPPADAKPPSDAKPPPDANPPGDTKPPADAKPPSDGKPPTDAKPVVEDKSKLKYLDFVQVAVLYGIASFLTLYEFAKENSGPLKHGVQTVEGTVQTVVGPVYEKFHTVPFELLKFVDHKVEELLNEVDRRIPSLLKQVTYQALLVAQKAPELARDLAADVRRYGLVETANNVAHSLYTEYGPIAKELYAKYEPVAEKSAVSAWRSLNRLPLFPQMAQILVPTAAYWSEKYNQAVNYASENGFTASYYFPLIPLERIAKVFGGGGGSGAAENGHAVTMNGESAALAQ